MLTLNQYSETNKKRTVVNNITFKSSGPILKNITTAKDSVVLSQNIKLNNEALKWIKSVFGRKDDSATSLFYKACSNSDDNISETALGFLKTEISKRDRSLLGFLRHKEKPAYQNFGEKFLAIMLEAAKNNEKNHTDSNIDFLDTVLKHFESDTPKDYLDVVVSSKDSEGNINVKTPEVFKMFYSQNGNTAKYFNFMKGLLALPKNEQNFIFSNFSKHSNSVLFKLLQLSQGNESEKLINAISEDLSGHHPEWMASCLEWSKDANNEPNLYNYRKILYNSISVEQCINYAKEIRDTKGIIQDSNVYIVSELQKLFDDKKLSEDYVRKAVKSYFLFLADNQNVANKEFADKFINVIKSVDYKNDYLNVLQVAESLKNKKNEVSDEALKSFNVLYSFRDSVYKSAPENEYGKAFPKTMEIIKDKEGNIIPEFIPYISDLTKSGLATSVPYILQISKGDKSVNEETFNSAKEFIIKYSSQYKKDYLTVASSLTKLIDKDGYFDLKALNVLNTLVKTNPSCDIFSICSAVKDSNGEISDMGLKFAESLFKDFQKQKDDFYINTINLAKDKKGEFNENNILFIKKIINITDKVKQYTETAKDSNGIVDKNFGDNLIKILSENKNPDDYKNIIECIKLLTNQNGVVQWQSINYVTSLKRYTDKSSDAQKHDTFKKIVNLITDKDGNIITSFNDYALKINEMIKDGLLIEIPVILNMVQKDGELDGELCAAIKALVLNEPADKRYETAKKLADLGKNNGFDKEFFTKLSKISNLKIDGDKYKIMEALRDSNDKISQVGFDFLVYLRKECHIKEEKDIISFLKLSKDKAGDFSNLNISLIKDISKVVPKYDIAKVYISASKQSAGIVDKNYYDNLIDILSKHEHPEDYTNILSSISSAKNKKDEIQWNYVNDLYKLKRTCDESKMGKKFNTFVKILSVIKDGNGNIVPELFNAVDECQHEQMLYEIPTIISLSMNKNQLDKDNYQKVVKILKDTATEDRYKMSEYIKEQAGNAGGLNNPKIKTIERLQARNISKNLLGISHYLKNPDGSISVTGLKLVSDLRKTYHHQIESDLVKILKLCRDKTGYINKKNVDAVKEILSINKNIDVVGLVKSTLNYKGEIDSDKYKTVIKLITEHHMSDSATINKVINMSRDKKGNIDSGILKLFVTLAKKGKKPENYNNIIPAYKALYKYEHVTSLSQLNLRQKRDLMRALKRYYHSDMQTSQFKEILSSKIFPSDESEYCSIMGRLSHNIGISVKKLPKDVESKYYKAMKILENPKGDFMNWDFDKNPPVLELKYSLKDFKRDIMDTVANYSYSERTKALDYYGFELKKTDGGVELSGFPNVDKPDGRLSSIKDKRVLHLINKLSPYVIEFVQQNNITVKGSKEMSEALTDIITAFPEFLTTVGKRQHHTHDYTLDVHCLKVLQDVFNNPEYQTLSHTDRKEMQIIALFHDLSKAENQVDKEHPENSAFNVYYLLNKLDMKEKDKLEIYNVIRNHDWLTHFDFSEYAAKDIAFNMRGSESLKMLLMLSQADLKGVKKYDTYYKMYGSKLKKAGMKIQPYLRDLQRTAINLPQTKIPKASELNQHSGIVDKIHSDGITNTVLYLKPNYDLGKAGFKSCRSTDDFNVLVHGLDSKDSASMFQALGVIDSNALLSTSYILYSKGNYRAFRNEGFVLDVAATNIHAAYWRDFGSGYRKTIKETLYNTYLFRNNPTREYISGQLRQELKLTDKEYIQLFKQIEDMPIEELEKKHPHAARAYRKLFNDMEVSKRSFGRNYNEVLLSSPKIQGIFCYGKSPESVSVYLRRYAEKNDIPIIVFG